MRLALARSNAEVPRHRWLFEREIEVNLPLEEPGVKLPHKPDGYLELEEAGRPDYHIPSLIERIGHLEALRKEEHKQMREIGLIPREPPLVTDNTMLKLNRGKEERCL